MATDILVKQNLDLLESGNFSDAEIVCNGTRWKVHKLILRSRCFWFDKAFDNNWKEAQTGQIHLDDEQPEQVDKILKYIYSGRHIPSIPSHVGCISTAVLAEQVSLWRIADFFLLSDLKGTIQEYLILRFAHVLAFFNDFWFDPFAHKAVHNKLVGNQEDLDTFLADFSQAVTEIYKSPGARWLHKSFAVFACGIRELLPAHAMRDLMNSVPEFEQDVSTALIALHFPKATDEAMRGGPQSLRDSEAWKINHLGSTEGDIGFSCSKCGEQSPKIGKGNPNEGYDVVLEPFPLGTRKWCTQCANLAIKIILETLVSEWPADTPGSD